jgi:hypothetical protein
LLASLEHSLFGYSRRTWPSIAGLHRVLRWSSASANSFADFGGGILSFGFIPQGRAFAVVADVLRYDDEHFGFSDTADVDCGLFAAGEQHQSSGEQVRHAA